MICGRRVDQYIGAVRGKVNDKPETHCIFSGDSYGEVILTRWQIAKIKSARVVNYHISHPFAVSDYVGFVLG